MIRFAVILVLLLPSILPARDSASEKPYRDEVAAAAPEALPDFIRATDLAEAGKCGEALPLYKKVVAQAPQVDSPARRYAGCLAMSGEVKSALPILQGLLARNRSAENLGALANALIQQPNVSKPDLERALSLALESRNMPLGYSDPSALMVATQAALKLQDLKTLRTVSAEMLERFPKNPISHYFAGVIATQHGDYVLARKEFVLSKQLGIPPSAGVDNILAQMPTRSPLLGVLVILLFPFAAWAAGLLALYVIGKILSRKALDFIEAADPNEAIIYPSERRLRSMYRKVVQIAAAYYYLSMPFVAVLIVLVTCAILGVFLMIGFLPIQLALVLGIGALVTLFRMVQVFFVKVTDEQPGRLLKEEEAPGLWALTREVAERVGTRPIDEIRLLPGTDLAVYESGTEREKRSDRARRVLFLGFGVVPGFTLGPFRAVLAHEYGHFSHRDTAGGEIAMRMQKHLFRFLVALVNSRQAAFWNAGFQFIRLYLFLFRRISHGAMRMQEVLADRVAARLFGPSALEQGMKHVIRRGVMFQHSVQSEIRAAVASRRPMENLYALAPPDEATVESRLGDMIYRATSEDDTHPSPTDRFRYIERIPEPAAEPDSGEFVFSFFRDPESITRELTEAVSLRVG